VGRCSRHSRVFERGGVGQSLTEFAVLMPTIFLVLMGIFEMALLMYGIGVARFATGEAARVLAQEGNVPSTDQDALSYIRNQTPIGGTNIRVNHIDVYRLNSQSDGSLVRDTSGCSGNPCLNQYKLDGSFYAGGLAWDPRSRNIGSTSGDYVGIDINFTYTWKEGLWGSFLGTGLTMTSTAWMRLEPQVY
jgi:hypothetical protein